jgi:hypothetical protein
MVADGETLLFCGEWVAARNHVEVSKGAVTFQ